MTAGLRQKGGDAQRRPLGPSVVEALVVPASSGQPEKMLLRHEKAAVLTPRAVNVEPEQRDLLAAWWRHSERTEGRAAWPHGQWCAVLIAGRHLAAPAATGKKKKKGTLAAQELQRRQRRITKGKPGTECLAARSHAARQIVLVARVARCR